MVSHLNVGSDLAEIRSQLLSQDEKHRALLRLCPLRPLLDIFIDWSVIFLSVGAVVWLSRWVSRLAVFIIPNRQRALGNILHDAGHRNLWKNRSLNDLMARILIAPLLFTSLTSYREAHFKHHLALGKDCVDPDFLPIPTRTPRHWLISFARNLCSSSAWCSSITGHLFASEAGLGSKLYIRGWWLSGLIALIAVAGEQFTTIFLLLWFLARATVFHLITTFREMCDHFGLQPGGVFSFTRDMTCHGVWCQVIHPRNNGYHLTHHLLPAMGYFRLPAAHDLLRQTPAYLAKGTVCNSYFSGTTGVVRFWQAVGARQ
jgi:fatty acid desaturase